MDYITRAWNALVKFVRPDVDAIIQHFLTAQRKLDAFIVREEDKLAAEAKAIKAAIARRNARNNAIDRAYRIIHNLDGIIA